jgi:hypothetical protein
MKDLNLRDEARFQQAPQPDMVSSQVGGLSALGGWVVRWVGQLGGLWPAGHTGHSRLLQLRTAGALVQSMRFPVSLLSVLACSCADLVELRSLAGQQSLLAAACLGPASCIALPGAAYLVCSA